MFINPAIFIRPDSHKIKMVFETAKIKKKIVDKNKDENSPKKRKKDPSIEDRIDELGLFIVFFSAPIVRENNGQGGEDIKAISLVFSADG